MRQEGFATEAKTEIFDGPVSVDTDLLDDAESTFHLGLEAAWRKGPFILSSEYIQSKRQLICLQQSNLQGLLRACFLRALAVKCVSTISAADYLKELISPMELIPEVGVHGMFTAGGHQLI